MSSSGQSLAPGTYRFSVGSTEEAVALIRDRLGPNARVLSVRSVPETGWRRYFGRARLEIVAQADPPPVAPHVASERAPFVATSAAPARPGNDAVATPDPRVAVPRLDLRALLRRSGLTETTLDRLRCETGWTELTRLPLHRALAETSRLLRAQCEPRPDRAALTRVALLGGAGVGRTTVLCKLLAQEVFRRGRIGHVVAVEFDQPNPLGPLPVFTEALGVPLAHFPCATRPVVPDGFVLFDLPSISPSRGPANDALQAFLEREEIEQRVLVLNAAYDSQSLRAAHAAGRSFGATHLVFTHLDEVPQWGRLWDYLFDETLEPLFLATGPSLTGDCEEDVTGAMARRTLPDERETTGEQR
jgi:flagellar biosynthesis protein FlhF